MQPGLERLFQRFIMETEMLSMRKNDKNVAEEGIVSERNSAHESLHDQNNQSSAGNAAQLKNALERLVMSAIDLFQQVDKQQLILLGTSTDLSGPRIERLIERYVTEYVHDRTLFKQVCDLRYSDDRDLESAIRHMEDVDVSQIGASIEGGMAGKREILARVHKAVETFKRMGAAESPQEMLEILLETEKCLTVITPATDDGVQSEKSIAGAFNADTLVSLLLLVVIRSPVRHLFARQTYMQDFMFINDAETGEAGYALSTFEAVLSYLSSSSGGLKKASRANRNLWEAVRGGNVAAVRKILEPDAESIDDAVIEDPPSVYEMESDSRRNSNLKEFEALTLLPRSTDYEQAIPNQGLAHVFPFQTQSNPGLQPVKKVKKRVSMEARSMSSSSIASIASRASTVPSNFSFVSGDTSVESLAKTQGRNGGSLLMMAINANQPGVLDYLLQSEMLFTFEEIFDDRNDELTTLLSAAIQAGNRRLTTVLLRVIQPHANDTKANEMFREYLCQQDSQGRSATHYLFEAPWLISMPGIPWRLKDKNGQTPLFALCRSYDHSDYHRMVGEALVTAAKGQKDGERLHLDDHVDNKNNSLLHIVNDPVILRHLLYQCDSDPNLFNSKRFTPLMVASKFARVESVRTIFNDPRTDLQARDLRGLTALELAKDDEVRNRIDDMVLLATRLPTQGRSTMIVRSFLVDDGSIRLVVKSAAPNSKSTITVTTCRRSLADFENLARWLHLEHPASWLPSIHSFRSPFQVPSRPSRSALRDLQLRLNYFLHTMLAHSTFGTHEMLWEFFLVPDIDHVMQGERARQKADLRKENIRDEFQPLVEGIPATERFISFARDQVFNVHSSTRHVLRRVYTLRNVSSDLSDARRLCVAPLRSLAVIPDRHLAAFEAYAAALGDTEYSPFTQFAYALAAGVSATTALLNAFSRPAALIASIAAAQDAINRHTASAQRSSRWPYILDDARSRAQGDGAEKAEKARADLRDAGCELSYTQQTLATELAGWQEWHAKVLRDEARTLVRRTVVVERARLEVMRRALRKMRAVREEGGV